MINLRIFKNKFIVNEILIIGVRLKMIIYVIIY